MPTTRRSTRSSTGAGKQSTLSFKHKVTKAIQTGKEGYKSPSRAKEYIPEPTPEPSTAKATSPKTDDDDDNQQPLTPTTPTAAGDDESQATLVVQTKPAPQPAVAAAPEKTDAELKAAKITDKAIERYWSDIESSRNARAVHKKHGEGLTTGEKVLRYFDVSSQYGVRINSFYSFALGLVCLAWFL